MRGITGVEPRYQGLSPTAPIIQLTLYHRMVVQSSATMPPVSPLLAFHDQYAKPCNVQAAEQVSLLDASAFYAVAMMGRT